MLQQTHLDSNATMCPYSLVVDGLDLIESLSALREGDDDRRDATHNDQEPDEAGTNCVAVNNRQWPTS